MEVSNFPEAELGRTFFLRGIMEYVFLIPVAEILDLFFVHKATACAYFYSGAWNLLLGLSAMLRLLQSLHLP